MSLLKTRTLLRITILLLLAGHALAQAKPNGAALFSQRCLLCHGPGGRAPQLSAMAKLRADVIESILSEGIMKEQATGLSADQRHALADYIGRNSKGAVPIAAGTACAVRAWNSAPASGDWTGWSPSIANTRYQPSPGLSPAEIPSLKLKWAFVFPDAATASNQIAIVGGRAFVAGWDGTVYALDANSGCSYWTFKADSGIRTGISLQDGKLLFGDFLANAYALDPLQGKLFWKQKVDTHPYARITGSPAAYKDKLYVPVASLEEGVSGDPNYACCTFRGSLVALDISTGKQLWKTYTIDQEAKKTGVGKSGVDRLGPSGSAVWSAPTIDAKRGLVYFATGNNYSGPDTPGNDGIFALNLETGAKQWVRALRAGDVWNASCMGDRSNCPDRDAEGPDFDFGSSPVLAQAGNRDLLLAGQKSGMLYALDPATGVTVWELRIGKGSSLGGVEWGFAADSTRAYVAISDWPIPTPTIADGALNAVDLGTGKLLWRTPSPADLCQGRVPTCSNALAAAVTVIPGIVFEGSLDGFFRAYDAATGKVLWEYDTFREFVGVNGAVGNGGSVNGAGATVAGGLVFQTTGYAAYGLGMPGNVLLVFGPEAAKSTAGK
jgi:polyvinyl alcohol dehydrogenase (cytochrome)